MASDITAHILDEISHITAWDKLEQEHIADASAWVASGVNIFRIAKPDKPPKHLVSYFVLIDPDHRSLLLGDHIKAQLWLPNGGHVEPNEHPWDTVIRECLEEVYRPAVFLRQSKHPFFITCTETGGLTPGHTDVSLWYLLRGSIHDSLSFDRGEFTDMNWFSFQEVLESHPVIFDPNMHRFTHKLAAYLDT